LHRIKIQKKSSRSGKTIKISPEFKDYFLSRLKKHKYLNFECIEYGFNPESLFFAAEQSLPSLDEVTNAISNVIIGHSGDSDDGCTFAYMIAQLCGVPNQNHAWESIFEKKELKSIVNEINFGYWTFESGLPLEMSAKIIANEFLELPKIYDKKLLEHPVCEGIKKMNELYIEEFGDQAD
jgi:hypothetical protein